MADLSDDVIGQVVKGGRHGILWRGSTRGREISTILRRLGVKEKGVDTIFITFMLCGLLSFQKQVK